MMIEAARNLPYWRSTVANAAVKSRVLLRERDVELSIIARWQRPSSHFTSKGEIRVSSPDRPGYADCDKIARAICDALAGIAYRNDRQVAVLKVERRWCREGEHPGATITINELLRQENARLVT